MCGIVGIIGRQPAAPLLLEALKRLEYRGYDSAGIATLVDGRIDRRRAEGKLVNLEAVLGREPLAGVTGIGHTRWATHGPPTRDNAHPHEAGGVAVVHNGIIENFETLRDELTRAGHTFTTQTDTEVVPQLVSAYLAQGMSPVPAAEAALARLHGAFALVLLFAGHDDLLVCARRGSPLAIGYGDGEMYVGSDALALALLTDRIQYLEEGDWAVLTPRGATIYDSDGEEAQRPITQTAFSGALIGKGNYRHFMHKEIHEQPAVLGDTLRAFTNPADHTIMLPELPIDFAKIERLAMVACGTASYACMVGALLVRAAGRPAGRPRHRLRVPLPRRAADAGQRRPVRLAVRRDHGHARGDALRQGPGPQDHRRWSTCPRARWRARPTAMSARWPGRRSASPRPRRSRPSSRRSPAWRSPRPGRAAA